MRRRLVDPDRGGMNVTAATIDEAKALKLRHVGSELHALCGEATLLAARIPRYRAFPIGYVETRFMVPLMLGQYRLYRGEGGRTLAFITWAFLSDELDAAMTQGKVDLKPEDWHSGSHLWFMDALSPYPGFEGQWIDDLRRNVFPDKIAKAQRVEDDGKTFTIERYRGVKAPRLTA